MTTTAPAARQVERELVSFGDPQDAELLQTYFKTGPGEYGEGDVFLGVRMPVVRTLARRHGDLELADCRALLDSPHHEARMLALLILVGKYHAADAMGRDAIYELYLGATDRVNNWDLVDLSAPGIVGRHLEDRERSVLLELARSDSVWERRIAMVATVRFIRSDDLDDAFRIADLLLADRHDLIHKAVGWMLREVGKRDRAALESFLRTRYARMPRTMLRYAIEKFPEPLRQRYLRGEV